MNYSRTMVLFQVIIFIINMAWYGAGSYAFKNNSHIKIGKSTYSLPQLKKQFKTLQVVIQHNPAYKGKKKIYNAFDMNEILSKVLNVDLNTVKQGDILVAKTLDDYESKMPLIDFMTKGHAFLAYQELPDTIAADNKTKDGQWSYVIK